MIMKLEQFNLSLLGRASKSASYGAFAVFLFAAFAYLSWFCDFKKPNPLAPIALMLAAALAWQVFTLCYHRKFLPWVLAILYAFGLLAFALQ
jgi:hypothetical protein